MDDWVVVVVVMEEETGRLSVVVGYNDKQANCGVITETFSAQTFA